MAVSDVGASGASAKLGTSAIFTQATGVLVNSTLQNPNPKSQTSSPQAQTPNLKSKPQALNPKPQTPTLKPKP